MEEEGEERGRRGGKGKEAGMKERGGGRYRCHRDETNPTHSVTMIRFAFFCVLTANKQTNMPPGVTDCFESEMSGDSVQRIFDLIPSNTHTAPNKN